MKASALILMALSFGFNMAHASPDIRVGPLEPVTQFHDYRGGGITITPAGRMFVSMHPLDKPKYRVVEVMANGTKQPFPTEDWANGPEQGKHGLSSVIGIHSDSKGIVWMLDMGNAQSPAQLLAWDTNKNTLHQQITLPKKALLSNSFLQDFVIDEANQKIIIADMSFGNFAGATKPAFVIVDLRSGDVTRVLEGDKALMPQDRNIVIDASPLAKKTDSGDTKLLRFGLNPIAIDDQFQWIYFGAFNGTKIYRIAANALENTNISNAQLSAHIEEFGPKRPSDGIVYAPGAGIIVSDLENNAVGLTSKGHYQTLIQDKRLSWPDSFAMSNSYVYVTQDQLHQHPAFSQGLGNAKPPYTLYRFRFQVQ